MAAKSVEERIALIDAKIAKKKVEIESLEAQKQRLLHPVNMKTVMAKAKGGWTFCRGNRRKAGT